MKTLRLSLKLMGVLLASIGIGGCGDDDEGGNACITCTYDYGTYTDTYTLCQNDAYVQDILENYGITWDLFAAGLRAAANNDPNLTCD